MICNLKALGLALVAVLAFGVAAASPASAYQPKLTPADDTSADLTGLDIESHSYTFGFEEVVCELVHAEGKLPEPSKEMTLTAIYEFCHAHIIGFPTLIGTVTMNGCDYKYTINEGEPGTDYYAGGLEVECPPGKQIEVHIFLDATKHGANKPHCTYDIGPQSVKSGVTYANDTEAGEVTINTSVELAVKTTGPPACGQRTKVTYHGGMTLKGSYTTGGGLGVHIG